MGLTDIILFPIYTLLFAFLFGLRRKNMDDPILRRYHLHGFWIKVFGTVAYCIFSVYLSKGDSTYLYYPEGINITKLIFKDFNNVNLLFIQGKDFDSDLLANTFNKGYFRSESNYFVTKLVSFFSLFSFGSYSVISLCFSMFSYAGVWRLYKFFYEQYPHLHKELAIALIYLPTFVFWSSGILKDPLCTGLLGFFTYSMYRLFMKREGLIKNSIFIIISATLLIIVKPYILFSYLPFFLLFLVLYKLKKINNTGLKIVAGFFLVILGMLSFYLLQGKLKEEMGSLAIDKLTESVQTTQKNFAGLSDLAESSFSLGVEFDGSTLSLLKIAPAGINATLFRPYLWESKKVSTLLSSLESLAMMLFTLYVYKKARGNPLAFFGGIVKDPMITFCLLFAITFALFVGVTTLNFGTLVRYKIPCMPFYIIGLVLIKERVEARQEIKKAKKAMAEEQSGDYSSAKEIV